MVMENFCKIITAIGATIMYLAIARLFWKLANRKHFLD
jgi:cytochrome b561